MTQGRARTYDSTREKVDKLGRLIVGAEPYRPGDVISLPSVIRTLEVSRAMAREVLQVLHEKRLVKLRPRVGATVLAVDKWDVFDSDVIGWRLDIAPRFAMRSLTEVRQAIEPRAARLAAERAPADICRDLISLSRKLQALGLDGKFGQQDDEGEKHRDEYSAVDIQFHETLLRGSGNEMFVALTEPVTEALTHRIKQDWAGAAARPVTTSSAPGTAKPFPLTPEQISLWLHRGLALAIEQGHPTAAEAFSTAILAEFHIDGLKEPGLRAALRDSLTLLDSRGFSGDEWGPFEQAILAVCPDGYR